MNINKKQNPTGFWQLLYRKKTLSLFYRGISREATG